jgi:hypothetical protein
MARRRDLRDSSSGPRWQKIAADRQLGAEVAEPLEIDPENDNLNKRKSDLVVDRDGEWW